MYVMKKVLGSAQSEIFVWIWTRNTDSISSDGNGYAKNASDI